jgi:hypothetical protein
MALIDSLEVGKRIQKYEDFDRTMQKIIFWRNSVDMDKYRYFSEKDGEGKDCLIKFACEDNKDYDIRKRATPVRNFLSQIVEKYNQAVFRHMPERVWTNTLVNLAEDIDLNHNEPNDFFQHALNKAQIDGRFWAIIDSTASSSGFVSEAQVREQGLRTFLRHIPIENVLNFTELEGKYLNVLFMFEREDGIYARYYDKSIYIEMKIDKNLQITSMDEAVSHGFSDIPVKCLQPYKSKSESSVAPMAESQKTIINLLSLVTQEINEQTFTKWLWTGYRHEQDENGTNKVIWGSKRITATEQSGVQVHSLAADITQADSIRKQIIDELEALYRIAGLSSAQFSMESANLSGVSRLIAQEGFYLMCSKYKKAVQEFENCLLSCLFDSLGLEYVNTIYSDSYSEPDLSDGIQILRDTLAIEIPPVLKNKMVMAFANKFFNLSEDEKAQLESELGMKDNINQLDPIEGSDSENDLEDDSSYSEASSSDLKKSQKQLKGSSRPFDEKKGVRSSEFGDKQASEVYSKGMGQKILDKNLFGNIEGGPRIGNRE